LGVADDGFPVAEAGDVGVKIGQADERGGCLGSVEVEHAEDHLAFVLRGDVPGDQHPVLRKVQGDAAIGVAGRGDDVRAAAEIEHITVTHLPIDADRWCRWQSGGDLGVQLDLEVGEVRRPLRGLAANDGRVRRVGNDLCGASGGDLGRRASVIIVGVGEDYPVQVAASQADLGQRVDDPRPRAHLTGIDQRHRLLIAPEVGLVPAQQQPIQTGTQFHDAHAFRRYGPSPSPPRPFALGAAARVQ